MLQVLMNADLDEAVGVLVEPEDPNRPPPLAAPSVAKAATDEHWRWRQNMADRIAAEIDADACGVVALYLIGSVKNGSAGPASDIDLIVHFRGDEPQKQTLDIWLDGWSRALDEINYQRTGYRSDGLLDVHLVTDVDIEQRTSYAVKIGAVTDAARLLDLGSEDTGN